MDMAKTAYFRVYAEVDRWPPLIKNWRIAKNRKDNPFKTIGGGTNGVTEGHLQWNTVISIQKIGNGV